MKEANLTPRVKVRGEIEVNRRLGRRWCRTISFLPVGFEKFSIFPSISRVVVNVIFVTGGDKHSSDPRAPKCVAKHTGER